MAQSTDIMMRDQGLDGRGAPLVAVSFVLTCIAMIMVLNRIYFRLTRARKLGADDWAILVSITAAILLSAMNITAVDHGYGQHAKSLPQNDLVLAEKMFWLNNVFYKITINATKLSIVFLYLRVFSVRWLDAASYAMALYVLCYGLASVLVTLFECTPVVRSYDRSIAGTCINFTAFWLVNAAHNMISDIIIFLMPMPTIYRMTLGNTAKYGLMVVFSLGLFVCIITVIRMSTLITASKSSDPMYGTYTATLWTTIEANTGIICACVPMLQAPIMAMLARKSSPDAASEAPNPIIDRSDQDLGITTATSGTAHTNDSASQSSAPINRPRDYSFSAPRTPSSDTLTSFTSNERSHQSYPDAHTPRFGHVYYDVSSIETARSDRSQRHIHPLYRTRPHSTQEHIPLQDLPPHPDRPGAAGERGSWV